jgi:peptidyl-prolyl cis-trans isomerase SurA
MTRFLATLTVAITLGLAGLATPGAAQQPFAAAATVNGQAITNFQVQQRARFFGLLRAPNADAQGATDVLIDEALQVQAARAAGVELTAEDLDAGLVEFAGRANLSPDAFIAALEQEGVAAETFRDFVRNGLYWRNLVQERFGPQSRPNEAEVRRTLARGGAANVRVLLSEIALPLTPENQAEQAALAQRLSDTISGQAAFEQAARTYSKSNSARSGGRIDYVDLNALAPPIASQVLTLAPGEISDPVNLGSFIGLFILRGLDDSPVNAPTALSVDYAEYLIPGGRTAQTLGIAAQLQDRIDACDDLYGVLPNAGQGQLTRQTVPTSSLAGDLRQELAKLDEGEVSTLLTRDGFLRFIMMCGREVEADDEAFTRLGQQLLNQRLGSYADGLLAELRADAIITR